MGTAPPSEVFENKKLIVPALCLCLGVVAGLATGWFLGNRLPLERFAERCQLLDDALATNMIPSPK